MQDPCSRSAHDQNVLARRPQWDLHGCHSWREEQASLEGLFKGDSRSMRAVKGNLATPFL